MSGTRLLVGALAVSLLTQCQTRREPVRRILLVTVDTIRADHLGYTGHDVETPNLDGLAASGAVFTQTITAAPITLPAHASILSGLYPSSHGTRFNGLFRVSDEVSTVAERLQAEGFATGAFVGAFVLDRRFGLAQGFDVYDDELPRQGSGDPMEFAERRAEAVVARALEFLKDRSEERLFLWVHLYDPHLPHDAPAPFADRYPDRPYDAEIAYTDAALGPLLEAVSRDDTAILFIGDHGEGLGDHGESTHTLFVYDSTMRVPLVLRAPGVPPGSRIDRQVRSVDVAPTILELAGLPPGDGLDGVSLLGRLEPDDTESLSAYGETFGTLYQFNWSELRFLRSEGFKFIEAPKPELYDLRADPDETDNLWSDNPPEVGKRLRRELDRLAKAEAEAPAEAVDEETRQRLLSLGYLTAGSAGATGATESSDLPDPKDRVEIFERLQGLLARGVPADEQIRGFREVLELEPGNILAQKRIAGLLAEEGRLEEAVAAYQDLLRMAELETKDWENLISALLLLDRREEALALSEQALVELPFHPELHVLRGEAFESENRLEDASRAYTKAVELEPELPQNYWRRGTVALALGDTTAAERDFRESLARDATFEEARLALARLLAETGRDQEAIALVGDAEGARSKATLAEALLAAGRYDEARIQLEAALELDPENARALVLLGPLYGRAGDFRRAADTLERALALGETGPEIRRNLALVYLQQGNPEAAIAQLRRASEESPDEPTVWFSLGNAYLRARRPARAIEGFEQAIALRPDWPDAIFNLALAYEATGRTNEAKAAYERFLALPPGDANDASRRAEARKRLSAL